MAASSSSLHQRGERRGRWGSPERRVVWTEPPNKAKATRKVAVVYYLCHRDGHLDHPHFLEMKLPISSSHSHLGRAPAGGLYLRDFTARLNALRGSGMAGLYSWSFKRSYKNGYVWQDLSDDDLIHPAHASDEYVLKGSPLLLFPQLPASSSTHHHDQEDRSAGRRRKNWSSFDLGDRDYSSKLAVAQQCAATQTDTDGNHGGAEQQDAADQSTELGIDEISPPPSSSSPDSCGRSSEVGVISGGRMRASAVLLQLFSCGSMATVRRPAPGHARRRSSDLMVNRQRVEKEAEDCADPSSAGAAECLPGVDRDYFSGSLVKSSKTSAGDGALLLKRSSSCNADRESRGAVKLPVAAKEVRAAAGCLASRPSRAPKKNITSSRSTPTPTVPESCGRDGGECQGAMEPTPDGSPSIPEAC